MQVLLFFSFVPPESLKFGRSGHDTRAALQGVTSSLGPASGNKKAGAEIWCISATRLSR
jgi:hypothetical protein